jgi:hypothetical protein
MKKKLFVLVAISLISFNRQVLSEGENPNSSRTQWQVVVPSLTNFLDDGWKLVGQSSYRAATPRNGGVMEINELAFVYTLFKNGKYVTCIVNHPKPESPTYSSCRSLN